MRIPSLLVIVWLSSAAFGQEDFTAGTVICGKNHDVICQLPDEICCQGLSSAKCTTPDKCTGPMSAPAFCDGPEDCQDGSNTICCAKFSFGGGSGTRCVKSCAGTKTEAILCHTNDDCESPRTCKSCQPPGGASIKMCVEQCPY